MKRAKNQISKIIIKKPKVENEVHPVQLVFDHIDDPKIFQKTSFVCKEWQQILDNHIMWKNICKKLGFKEPKLKAKIYKTWKSIFLKNNHKLCKHCYKNISSKSAFDIYFKLSILKKYCDNRLDYKVYFRYPYNEFVLFTKEQIEKLITKLNINGKYKICSDCEQNFFKSIQIFKDKIYKKKKDYEQNLKSKKFCDFVKKDFVNIIFHNFYNIIENRSLFIQRYGGIIKNWDHPELDYIEY